MRRWADRFFELKSWFRHIMLASGPHGVHSPFVFDILTKFSHSDQKASCSSLRELRGSMLRDQRIIEKMDLGTGSSGLTRVREIAKRSCQPIHHALFMGWLSHHLESKHLLELGSSIALSTSALAKLNPSASVTSVEGCEQTALIASENLQRMQVRNVELVCSDAKRFLEKPNVDLTDVDFVFIDCNHTYEATLEYFYELRKLPSKNLALIFDDIYWSREMNAAWKRMLQLNCFDLSIDFFHFGILMRREGKRPENFRLRLPV